MQKASSALDSLIKELGMESALMLYRIRANWASLFNGPLSLHLYPAGLKDGHLLINADSPVWLQETSFHRLEIIGKLGGYGVKDIRLKLGRVKRAGP